jgi:hypothetical protein
VYDYNNNFIARDLNTSIDLSIYESPHNGIEASMTYEEEFEKFHL